MALAGALGSAFIEVFPQTGGFASELHKQVKEATDEATSKSKSMFDNLAGVGKAALLGIGGAAITAGTFALKMADTFEAAHARLEVAVKNSGKSMDDFTGQISGQEQKFQNLGINMSAYEDALASLTGIVNDPTKAIGLMGTVADLAAAKHLDLQTAAKLVGRVAEGNTTILQRYGIVLDVTGGKASQVAKAHDAVTKATDALTPATAKVQTALANLASVEEKVNTGHLKGQAAADALRKAHDAVTAADANLAKAHDNLTAKQDALTKTTNSSGSALDALAQKFGGSAAAQAETFGGKVKALETTAQNLGVVVGLWLVPKLEALAAATLSVVNWLEKHKEIAEALAIAIGGVLLVAIGAFVVSLFEVGGALAFITLPLLAIMAAVALFTVGIVELWTHWDQIWNWMAHHKAYAIIIAATLAIVAPFVLVIVGLMALAKNWQQVWDDIRQWTMDAVNPIVGAWNAMVAFFKHAMDDIVGAWNATVSTITGIAQAVAAVFSTVAGAVATAFNDVRNVIVGIVTDVVGWIDAHWKLLLIILTGPFGLAALGIAQHIAGIQTFLGTFLGWLEAAWNVSFGVVTDIFNTFTLAVQAGANWLWHAIFEPVFNAISNVVAVAVAAWTAVFNGFVGFITNIVAPNLLWLWHNIVEPVFNGIASVVTGAWNGAQSVLQSGVNFLGGAFTGAFTLLQTTLAGVWGTIKTDASSAWDTVTSTIKGAVNSVIDIINGLIGGINAIVGAIVGKGAEIPVLPKLATGGYVTNGPAIIGEGNQAYPEVVVPTDPAYRSNAVALLGAAHQMIGLPMLKRGGIVGDITGAASAVGHAVSGAVGSVGNFVGNLGGDALSLLRQGAVDLLLAPLFATANAAMGAIHVPFMTGLIHGLEDKIKAWALGQSAAQQAAYLPGGGTVTGDPGSIIAKTQQWLGTPYLWGGGHGGPVPVGSGIDCSGLVDQVFGITGNTTTQIRLGSAVPDLASSLPADLVFFGALAGINAAADPHHVGIISQAGGGQMIDAPHTGSFVRYDSPGGFGGIDGIRRLVSQAAAIGQPGGTPIPGVGIPGGGVVDWLTTAMADAGVGNDWLPGLEIIAKYESGNNPNAVNRTDINAQMGTPSEGLMQTIGPTFNSYKLPGHDNIFNPVDNAIAAIRYIESRYGYISKVPGVRNVEAGGSYVGYDSGGWLMPGLTMAVNNTGLPERVTPPGSSHGGTMTIEKGAVQVSIVFQGPANQAAADSVKQQATAAMADAFEDVLSRYGSARPGG